MLKFIGTTCSINRSRYDKNGNKFIKKGKRQIKLKERKIYKTNQFTFVRNLTRNISFSYVYMMLDYSNKFTKFSIQIQDVFEILNRIPISYD